MLAHGTLTWAAALAGYAFISFILLRIGYRLLLHPLHQYPGSLAAKLTSGYAGLYAIQKRLHLIIWRDHERYGPVIRLGPNRLVFNTTTALRDIYQNDRVTKSYTYLSTTRDGVVNLFTARNNAVHRAKRKLIGQAVNDRAMRAFEPTMAEQIACYLRQILQSARASEAVNMTDKARHLGLDIVGQLAFGYDLAVQTREDNRFIMNAMYFGNFRGNVYHHLPILSYLYTGFLDYVFYEVREKYWRLLETMIRSRVALGKDAKQDFYASVIDSVDLDTASMRQGDLWKEALFFLVAGGDTVATAICAAFFYLSGNLKCYETLANEIRSTFESGDDIKTGPQLAKCRYLRACIDEAMRMSPPVSTTLWREQVADDAEPLVIDGHFIPRGTLIGVNAYALHHNKEYFPDPFVFKPDRWLKPASRPGDGDASQEPGGTGSDAFAAFSIGPRGCAGKSMAYMETSLVLAKTLWYFDFARAPGNLGDIGGGKPGNTKGRDRPEEFQIEDIFTSRHAGPYLAFHTRGEVFKELGGDLGEMK